MDKNNSSSQGGIGFVGLLQITFIVLKLIGIIKWSWMLVLLPIWISLIVFLIVVAGLVVLKCMDHKDKKKW